jgi:GR25 family glycosyltransferase involved in LPS biosynthesis
LYSDLAGWIDGHAGRSQALMNITSFAGFFGRLRYGTRFRTRRFAMNPNSAFFSSEDQHNAIRRIYVINLDRQPHRWREVTRELGRMRTRSGKPLSSISRRFSAVDARYLAGLDDNELVRPHYSLADQLFVEPNPRLRDATDTRDRRINMTRQEVAVALSHIGVWKLVADGDVPYTLVLEDDVYFRRGFVRRLDEAWAHLMRRSVDRAPVDLLYLSFQEVGTGRRSAEVSPDLLRQPRGGLWNASGYVLSNAGAQKLLDLLPAYGPIDLWLNHQFIELDVLTTRRSLIEQRPDFPSTNSYSVLPVLSQVGVLTRENPLVVRELSLPGPVFALGESGSGQTALAMALSMLGYRCCSDLSELPASEQSSLVEKTRDRVFNAYVNIGSLGINELAELVRLYRDARLIISIHKQGEDSSHIAERRRESVEHEVPTTEEGLSGPTLDWLAKQAPGRVLFLPAGHPDKWELLSKFFGCDYPALPHPQSEDLGQRRLVDPDPRRDIPSRSERTLRCDSSPWIAPLRNWRGISVADHTRGGKARGTAPWNSGRRLELSDCSLRNDTFPSNRALFTPSNVSSSSHRIVSLALRNEQTSVRSFTSGAIASKETFLHGRFVAELRPSNVSGVITGMFLHRNGPRQEIDIEFFGKDTTKILANVYYNPGEEGTKLEFGYRGTPTLIDLGFDAAKSFHTYEIDWRPHSIRWIVDGQLIHERVLWDPTPIPDLPMQFNVNLWNSRSKKVAGKLNAGGLPTHAEIRSMRVPGRNDSGRRTAPVGEAAGARAGDGVSGK